jgi:hypothetical protein
MIRDTINIDIIEPYPEDFSEVGGNSFGAPAYTDVFKPALKSIKYEEVVRTVKTTMEHMPDECYVQVTDLIVTRTYGY